MARFLWVVGMSCFWALGCGGGDSKTCEPDCSGRECGPDPVCDTSCGTCDLNMDCNEQGTCECVSLCGSKCDILSCETDRTDCQVYLTPDTAIVVHYKQVLQEGERWSGKIIVDADGIGSSELRDGISLDGQEFLDRVLLQRPREAEQFGEFNGERCNLSLSSLEDGASLVGSCHFTFDDGYDLEAVFDCEVELIE